MRNVNGPIVFFDGVCGLCNGFVDFALRKDRSRNLRFAPLQGGTARALVGREAPERMDSIVLLEGGKTYLRSAAILRIFAHLGGPWRVLSLAGRLLPAPALDAVYRFVSRHRYGWFGRRDACRLPSEAEKAVFLD